MFKVLATVVTVPMALAAGFVFGVAFAFTVGVVDEQIILVIGGIAAGWVTREAFNIIW